MDTGLEQPTPQLAAIRTRSLFLLVFVGIALPIIVFSRVWTKSVGQTESFLFESVVEFSCYLFLGVMLWHLLGEVGLGGWCRLGTKPQPREARAFAALGLPLAATSLAGLYIVFLPLSWIAPEFVSAWLLKGETILRWSLGREALVGNSLNTITLLLLAPVVEELVFRGFLLNRWWKKYGLRKAIVLASLAFGLLHVEVIGGFVFGVVSSYIYVKSRSLIGPILVHSSNNALVFIGLLIEGILYGEISEISSLAEFQFYWWTGLLGLAIGVPWLRWFYKHYLSDEVDR